MKPTDKMNLAAAWGVVMIALGMTIGVWYVNLQSLALV